MYKSIESIKTGKMQYCEKNAKTFRDTIAKWHNADFELADEILQRNERVNAVRTLIASNNRLIEKLNNNQTVIGGKTVESITAENVKHQATIDKHNADLAEFREKQAERYAQGHALLNKELYKAYVEYITKDERDAYILALANFFESNGITPALDSLNDFVAVIGKKKNSARQKCKTGQHNGAFTYNTWRDIFLGEICDVMGNAIPTHKFVYVLKEERQGKNK